MLPGSCQGCHDRAPSEQIERIHSRAVDPATRARHAGAYCARDARPRYARTPASRDWKSRYGSPSLRRCQGAVVRANARILPKFHPHSARPVPVSRAQCASRAFATAETLARGTPNPGRAETREAYLDRIHAFLSVPPVRVGAVSVPVGVTLGWVPPGDNARVLRVRTVSANTSRKRPARAAMVAL